MLFFYVEKLGDVIYKFTIDLGHVNLAFCLKQCIYPEYTYIIHVQISKRHQENI